MVYSLHTKHLCYKTTSLQRPIPRISHTVLHIEAPLLQDHPSHLKPTSPASHLHSTTHKFPLTAYPMLPLMTHNTVPFFQWLYLVNQQEQSQSLGAEVPIIPINQHSLSSRSHRQKLWRRGSRADLCMFLAWAWECKDGSSVARVAAHFSHNKHKR